MNEMYFYISVFLALLGAMIWIICLYVNKRKLERENKFISLEADQALKELLDEYIVYCRNNALKKRKEEIKKRSTEIKQGLEHGIHYDYWETCPEEAVKAEEKMQNKLSKCSSVREFSYIFYREIPDVVFTFLCAQEDGHGFFHSTSDEEKGYFIECLEKYHLDLDSKRHAFDYD